MLLKERRLLLSTLGTDSLVQTCWDLATRRVAQPSSIVPAPRKATLVKSTIPAVLLMICCSGYRQGTCSSFLELPDTGDPPLLLLFFLWSDSCRFAARIGFWSAFWDSSYTPHTPTTPHQLHTEGLGIYNLFSTQSLFYWYLESRAPTN